MLLHPVSTFLHTSQTLFLCHPLQRIVRVEIMEKSDFTENTVTKRLSGDDPEIQRGGLNDPNHVELTRALKARHITMIGR